MSDYDEAYYDEAYYDFDYAEESELAHVETPDGYLEGQEEEETADPFWDLATLWSEVPVKQEPAGHTFFHLRLVFFKITHVVSRETRSKTPALGDLGRHLLRFFQGLSRFMRKHDAPICDHYGVGHLVASVFTDLLPHVVGTKSHVRSVNREARDLLYRIYDALRAAAELAHTVPVTNRPTVSPTVPNPSPTSTGESKPSSSSEAAESIRKACRQANLRAGEASKAVEEATGLELTGPYGPHGVWFPLQWTEWECFEDM